MTTTTTNPHLIYLLILIQMMSVNRMQVQKLLESISLEGEDERPSLEFRTKDHRITYEKILDCSFS